ncbi:MAG: diadenylate cyclase CdaA [Clostridia bacterium]|nr:diadenylate cyclase CdaA [Clostridia bacterium]
MADLLQNFGYLFSNIKVYNVIDIAIVSFIIYKLLRLMRETRAEQLIKGIVIIAVAYVLSDVLKLYLLNYLIRTLVNNGVLALVILFQPELRKALERVGRSKLKDFKILGGEEQEDHTKTIETINALSEGLRTLQKQRMGALAVFERETKLGDIISTGTIIDSIPSGPAVGNIFFNKAPLHDGAMIIRNNKLYAAGCILPLSQNEEIDPDLGTRHRAAIGMSENSDAVVVVLSEETGMLSICINGRIERFSNLTEFTANLVSILAPEVHDEDSGRFFFSNLTSRFSRAFKGKPEKNLSEKEDK